jgi:hypothetical protein
MSKYLLLGDLWLIHNDLFENRLKDFQKSKICLTYEPILQAQQKKLNALPSAITAPKPLVEQLIEQDAIHDGSIDTLWYTTETILRSNRASAELKKAAQEIRDSLNLKPSDTQERYGQEALVAAKREEIIGELKSKLALFSLAEGGTLYDVALEYVVAGKKIGALLSERTIQEAMSDEDRKAIKTLRPTMIGYLGRCRAALGDEVQYSLSLPQNLDALIFGYLDKLNQDRYEANQRQKESQAKEDQENKIKASTEAKRQAAEAQLIAEEKAKEAQLAQRLAQEAAEKAKDE